MPISDILSLLRLEQQKISAAIAALEGGKRRGRPPKDPLANAPDWVLPKPKPEKKRRRRIFTAKQRAEQSKRAKAMWRKRKAAKTA